jgi:signal transduction histidine kinase/CheY-like chemotaxis protein
MHPQINRHFEHYLRDEKDRLSPAVLAFIEAINDAYLEVEIRARQLAEESISTRTEQILKHQEALHELALTTSDDLNGVLRNIVRVSARTLGVRRASIWLFNADRTEINEECLLADGRIDPGEPASLSIHDCPQYFEALHDYRTMAVSDAVNDPKTKQLASGYLSRNRIFSKLDASVRLHGAIVGIVCHEQLDAERQWTLEEEHFVASLADLVSLALSADERRNLEEQLRQAQKMEAVGLLAGGVSHDFSNLLTVMLVYADLLLARVRDDPAAVTFVDEIHRAALRAEALTRQLLAFSRKQVLNPKTLDLNNVLKNMENMLRPMIGEDIELITTMMPGLSCIKADHGQIEQVLMNLVVNARDAMPSGGRLRVSTSNLGPERPTRYRTGETPGTHFVVLTVSDTGIGMDDETLSRIFEPFFTTKKDGKGSGLGLSTVYGIVEQSGGQIEVDSRPGSGTTFRIYFPAVHETVEEPPEPPPAAENALTSNQGLILFVEDEDSLRQAAVHALREQGYQVLDVRNGIEAVRLCRDLREELHLLITDVVMPQMDGRQLAAHISLLRPKTKILYVSGYAKGAILDKGSLEPNAEFLAKPFRLSELIQKVREVLGSVSAARRNST